MDLALIATQLHSSLKNNQIKLEETITAWGQAQDEFVNAFVIYRSAKGKRIAELRKEGVPVSVLNDIVQGELAELKGACMRAEFNAKQLQKFIDAYEHRINNTKFLGRKLEELENGY